jgi:hypothetical protein
VEPPWGVEPQTYALRVTSTRRSMASIRDYRRPHIVADGSMGTGRPQFAPRLAPRQDQLTERRVHLISAAAGIGTPTFRPRTDRTRRKLVHGLVGEAEGSVGGAPGWASVTPMLAARCMPRPPRSTRRSSESDTCAASCHIRRALQHSVVASSAAAASAASRIACPRADPRQDPTSSGPPGHDQQYEAAA